MIDPNVREKICKDFYPNCKYCTCYSMCFPKNLAEDISSQILLEEQENRIKESLIKPKHSLVQNQS